MRFYLYCLLLVVSATTSLILLQVCVTYQLAFYFVVANFLLSHHQPHLCRHGSLDARKLVHVLFFYFRHRSNLRMNFSLSRKALCLDSVRVLTGSGTKQGEVNLADSVTQPSCRLFIVRSNEAVR